MPGRLLKILLGAVVVAMLVTILAVTAMKKEPTAEELLQQAKLQYPERDLLEDGTVAAESAPVPAPQSAQVSPPPNPVQPVQPVQQPEPAATAQAPKKLQLQIGKIAGTLKISSPTLKTAERIPLEHSCYRKNQSPALSWSDAPRGTQSLVVLFERLDAAEGDTLLWAVYNIPAATAGVAAGLPREATLTDGLAQATNETGNIGYVGPCDARGQFPYLLRVFALDAPLALAPGAKRDELINAMNGHIIDMAVMNLVHHYRL